MTPEQERLVEENVRLAFMVASRMIRRGVHLKDPLVDREDIRSVCLIGLMKAAQRFDPSRGFRFSTYAVQIITGEILNHMRNLSPGGIQGLERDPRTRAITSPTKVVSIDNKLEGEKEDRRTLHGVIGGTCDDYSRAELDWLKPTLARLTPRQRRIVYLRMADKTQQEIAATLGLAQVTISRELSKIKAVFDGGSADGNRRAL